MVSQEKWDKTKCLLEELKEMVTKGPLSIQRMLEIRGFLMYVVSTYTWLNPYMKGMHLTVDSWRPGRSEDGFKMTPNETQKLESSLWGRIGLPCRREDKGGVDHVVDMPERDGDCAPATVLPVGRYIRDLEWPPH